MNDVQDRYESLSEDQCINASDRDHEMFIAVDGIRLQGADIEQTDEGLILTAPGTVDREIPWSEISGIDRADGLDFAIELVDGTSLLLALRIPA